MTAKEWFEEHLRLENASREAYAKFLDHRKLCPHVDENGKPTTVSVGGGESQCTFCKEVLD
jgi:hypothetical protein